MNPQGRGRGRGMFGRGYGCKWIYLAQVRSQNPHSSPLNPPFILRRKLGKWGAHVHGPYFLWGWGIFPIAPSPLCFNPGVLFCFRLSSVCAIRLVPSDTWLSVTRLPSSSSRRQCGVHGTTTTAW